MLPTLRFAARRSSRAPFLLRTTQAQLPLLSFPVERTRARNQTASYTRIAPLKPKRNLRKKHQAPFVPIDPLAEEKPLPEDAKSYLEVLEAYATDDSVVIGRQRLKRLMKKHCNDSRTCSLLLHATVEFEKNHPDRRGLVDSDCFFYVIEKCVLHDHLVKTADELLTLCQSMKYVLPHRNYFIMVLGGYARLKTAEAIQRMEEILAEMEQERLLGSASKTPTLRTYNYTILINAYLEVLGRDALNPVGRMIEHMENFAERLRDERLRPNLSCYATLMEAYMRAQPDGFALEIHAILDALKVDPRYIKQPAKDWLYLECLALDAWSKTEDPLGHFRARRIFDVIHKPDATAYNLMMHTYAAVGDLNEVFRLYKKMQSVYKSGKNNSCRPNTRSFMTVLRALRDANPPDAAERARPVINDIPLNDTKTFSTLINMHSQKGDVENALKLARRMQSNAPTLDDGQLGNFDLRTYSIIMNALQKLSDPDAPKKAETVLNSIPLPNTFNFNILLHIFAERELHGDVVSTVRRMQTDFSSGKNRHCKPDIETKTIFLKALECDPTLESESQDLLEWFSKRPKI
jgi:pentatricopeptide repeat protein